MESLCSLYTRHAFLFAMTKRFITGVKISFTLYADNEKTLKRPYKEELRLCSGCND